MRSHHAAALATVALIAGCGSDNPGTAAGGCKQVITDARAAAKTYLVDATGARPGGIVVKGGQTIDVDARIDGDHRLISVYLACRDGQWRVTEAQRSSW